MRKLIYILFCVFLTEIASAQSKWEKGVTVGGCFNVMALANMNNNNILGLSGNFGTSGKWTFQHQAGLTIGFSAKRTMTERFSLQGELNIVWSRQKANFEDIFINDPSIFQSFGFPNQFTTKGTIQFNTVYAQLPFIVTMQLDAATTAELGIFAVRSLSNKSSQSAILVTLSEFDSRTGQVIVLPTPRTTQIISTPDMTSGSGWLVGLKYNLNKTFAVRMRYEGGMSAVADFLI